MNSKKLKRILSVALSLSIALSTNLTGFAAQANALVDGTEAVADETAGAAKEDTAAEGGAMAGAEDASVPGQAAKDGTDANPPECEEDAHDWEIISEIRPATCSQKGAYKVRCKICTKEDYTSTPRTGHTYELDNFVEITQADIDAGTAPEGAVVNTLITKPATCAEPGEKKYICGTCTEGTGHESAPVAISTLPHTWETEERHKDPTCTESGYFYKKCQNCDAETEKREDASAPKLYHTYEEEAGNDYDPSSIVEKIDGDCTKEHEVTYTCKREGCGNVAKGMKKYDSHLDGAVAEVGATCEYPAMEYTPCTRAGCLVRSNVQEKEGSKKLYHTYEKEAGDDYDLKASTTKDEAATCTEDGETIYTCQRPGCTDETSEYHTKKVSHPKTGHDYTSEKSISEVTKEATCKEKGIRTIHCGNAPEDPDHDKTEEIPITGHKWTDVPKQDATCGQDGYEAYSWCPVCGTYKNGEPVKIPADPTKHQYGGTPIVYKPATCDTNGIGKYVCTGCGNASIFGTIPAMHEYQMLDKDGNVVVNEDFKGNAETGSTVTGTDAGCLTKGYKTFTCGKCDAGTSGHTYSLTINALGHDYDEGKITTVPTCVKKGMKTFTCQRTGCEALTKGHSYTEDVDATGEHDYVAGQIIPATCTTPQMVGKACSVCKQADPESEPEVDVDENGEPKVAALGHTYADARYQTAEGEIDDDAYQADYPGYFSETEATCAKGGVDGKKVYTCANPGCEGAGHTKTVTSLAPAHKWEVKYEDADCQHAGYAYEKCSVCQEETDPEYMDDDPKKEHNYVLQLPVYKKATCTANGIGQYQCSMCKDVKNQVIPAHHAYEDDKHQVLTGDALKAMVDGKKVSVAEKAKATCAVAGEAVYTCLVCDAGTAGKDKEVTLPKLVHMYGEPQWKSEMEGNTHYGCVDDIRVQICEQPNCPETLDGHKLEEAVEATLEHDVQGVSETIQPATCTTPKMMVKICNTCHQATGEREATEADGGAQAALGHTYERAPYKNADGTVDEEAYKAAYPNNYSRTEPSCKGEGKKGKIVYTCADPNCDVKDNSFEVELAIPEHVWEPKFIEATCQGNAQSYEKCKNCGDETAKTDMGSMGDEYKQTGHDYQFVEAFREATCTKTGLGKYRCSMCEDVKNEVTPAHHAYEDEKHQVLAGDALQKMVEDKKVSVAEKTPATCTAAGEEIYTCLVCEENTEGKEKPVALPQLQHIFDEAKFTWKSVEDGGQHYDCQDDVKILACQQPGCKFTKEEAAPATANHDIAGVSPTIEEATCTLPKRSVIICKTCSGEAVREAVTGDEAQPALGHAFQKMENGQPVLDEDGNIVLVDDVDENPKVEAEGDLPTCTKGSVRTYTCLQCKDHPEEGNTIKVNAPATGHKKVEMFIDATCEEPGKVIMVCEYDNTERFPEEDQVLKDAQGNILDPALGHDQETVAEVKSTCKTKGHTAGVRCKRPGCQKTLSGIEELPLNPENHEWQEDLENTILPDCESGKDGVNAFYCEHEGVAEPFTKTENVKAEHKFVEGVSEDGKYIIQTCQVCGKQENLKLMYGFIECSNPECESYGEIVEADEIPRVAPTCTQKGKTKGLACPDCGMVFEGCEDIEMISHTLTWMVKQPATCGKAGSEIQHCSMCNQDIGEVRPIAATGKHEYVSEVQDPDCTHPFRLSFICKECGQADPERPVEEIGAPLGHNYVNGVCTNNCGIAPVEAKTSMEAFVDTKNKIRVTAITKVNDQNLEVVEMGLLYSTDANTHTEKEFEWYEGTSTGWLKKKILTDTRKDGVYMDIGVGSLTTRGIYGRAYVVTEDAEGNRSFTYGDFIRGTFEELSQ